MKNEFKIAKFNRAREILFVVVPPIAELDLTGAWSVFQEANRIFQFGQKPLPYRITIATAGDDLIVSGDFGLKMLAEKRLSAIAGAVDTLVVIGGSAAANVASDGFAVDWLRRNARKARRTASVCTGAFVLAAADLLDGKRATTHWRACAELARRFPLVKVENQPIFVQDGSVYTSAGVTAGIDLALELVEQDLGADISLEIARNMVMFLRRPGGQTQFSAQLAADAPTRQSLKNLQSWIAENLNQPLEVKQLAGEAAMSERNFARAFAREFGMTPARYVLQQRIEAARRELEQTKRGQAEIALRCGFKTAGNLRRTFARTVGATPEQYRARFSRAKTTVDSLNL